MAAARGLTATTALYATCTVFFGALMAATAKLVGRRVSTYEQIFLRSVLCLSASPAVGGSGFAALARSANLGWLVARGGLGFLAVVCYFEAVRRMPLAVVALVTRLHPLFGAIFAWLLLGEPLRPQQVVGILLGAAGAALAAPSSAWAATSATSVGLFYTIGATILTSLGFLVVRKLSKNGEDMAAVRAAFHLAGLLGGLALGFYMGLVLPTFRELGGIGVVAAATTGMQWGLSKLYQNASVVESLPFFFLSVVFNMSFGFLQGEPLLHSQQEALGAVFILAAVAIGSSGNKTANMVVQQRKDS